MRAIVKIMITGYPSLENAVEALNHGANAYVVKPVKPEKLLGSIEEKLEKQRTAEKMTKWIKTRARARDARRRSCKTWLVQTTLNRLWYPKLKVRFCLYYIQKTWNGE